MNHGPPPLSCRQRDGLGADAPCLPELSARVLQDSMRHPACRLLLAGPVRQRYHFSMLRFELRAREGFAEARLEGLVSLEAWADVLEELAAALRAGAPAPRLIIDVYPIVGFLAVPERRAVAAMMAKHFAHMQKVAIVVQPQKITGVLQDEAQRRGLSLQLFPNRDDAMTWVCC